MKRIVLVGCGNLGTIIAEGVNKYLSEEYKIAAVCDAREESAGKLAALLETKTVSGLEEILTLRPDYVVEAAGRDVVKDMAPGIIGAGIDMIILSVGALTDEKLTEEIIARGKKTGAKLHVASGAVGGFDLLRAVKFGGMDFAQIHTTKNPRSLNGAPYLNGKDLPEDKICRVFEGNSRQAIAGFPKNVNVSVSTALATLGVDNTQVKITSDPKTSTNMHHITASGDFGQVEIQVSVKPSRDNPKSSMLAAWSVLALLEKLSQVICL